MNKFIKVLSIVLTIAASTFLPSTMASESVSVEKQEIVKGEVVAIPQETTMKGWINKGGIMF